MSDSIRVSPDRLLDFATAIYRHAGMTEADARLAADTLVEPSAWVIAQHPHEGGTAADAGQN